MAHVLLADDDRDLAEAVGWYLESSGMQVTAAHNGGAALAAFLADPTDVVIVDIMMPGTDGFELCRQLRRVTDVPILVLSAREGEADKVRALGIGADDYVTKPFGPMELVARVKALLRRAKSGTEGSLFGCGIELCCTTRAVQVDGKPLDLTRLEFDLLAALMRHSPGVLSRGQLVELVWGPKFYGDERLVDTHVHHLRHKLSAGGLAPVPIATVRGVGYAFQAKR